MAKTRVAKPPVQIAADKEESKNLIFKQYVRVSLGRPAVFYLPSIKVNDPKNEQLSKEIHQFLLKNFGGYTAEKGNIIGYWRNQASIDYNENLKYTVAFEGKEKIPLLERFLARVAKRIGEEAIYLETGEDSWLIHTK